MANWIPFELLFCGIACLAVANLFSVPREIYYSLIAIGFAAILGSLVELRIDSLQKKLDEIIELLKKERC